MGGTGGEVHGLTCTACDGRGEKEVLAAHLHGPQPEAHEWRPVPWRCEECRGTGAPVCAVCCDLPAVAMDVDTSTGRERPLCAPCLADSADADVDAAADALRRHFVDAPPGALEALPGALRAVVSRVLGAVERQRRFTGRG